MYIIVLVCISMHVIVRVRARIVQACMRVYSAYMSCNFPVPLNGLTFVSGISLVAVCECVVVCT